MDVTIMANQAGKIANSVRGAVRRAMVEIYGEWKIACIHIVIGKPVYETVCITGIMWFYNDEYPATEFDGSYNIDTKEFEVDRRVSVGE